MFIRNFQIVPHFFIFLEMKNHACMNKVSLSGCWTGFITNLNIKYSFILNLAHYHYSEPNITRYSTISKAARNYLSKMKNIFFPLIQGMCTLYREVKNIKRIIYYQSYLFFLHLI